VAAQLELAREIVLQYGWNATAYQILNPGFDLWFSTDHRAVVGFTRRGPVLLVAGVPVCTPEKIASVCDEFERLAEREGRRVCYVCAEERLRAIFAHSPNHATIALGAQPAWNPRTWPEVIRTRPSLRAQLHRALNKGVDIKEVSPKTAARDDELRYVLQEWVSGRSLPPLHFLVEPNVLDGVLSDRVILAARRRGKPVAFLVASPLPAREGYLVELVARSSGAPNGSSELLIDAAMRRFADEGCRYATLGLVALAHAADEEIRFNPPWLRGLMYFARAHANRFYNFRGLEQFRLKMSPDRWETVYAIANEPRFSARTLYAVGGAFSGIPPWAAIAIGMVKALKEEIRGVRERIPGLAGSNIDRLTG
jgi:phosphatidylglycerol lysyltransferase